MNRIETYTRKATLPVAFALAAFVVAGCGGGSSSHPAPTPDVDPLGAICTVGTACVDLGTVRDYVILSRSGVTNVPTSVITGNVGTSPSTSITGFDLVADASGTFSTSAQVVAGGRVYAADDTEPTPTKLTAAIGHATDAFGFADAKTPTVVNTPVGGNLTGEILGPGVYTWDTGVSVDPAGAVTLTGTATDVWVLRTTGDITMGSGSRVTLAGGALPQNVFWRTAGVAALDTTAHMEGIVMSGTSITLATGATVNGRLIASTAVTLDANTVTRP
jgi:hypothetical protein